MKNLRKNLQRGDNPEFVTVLREGHNVGLSLNGSTSITIIQDEVYKCSYDTGGKSAELILELPDNKRVYTFFSGRFRVSYKNEVKKCKF